MQVDRLFDWQALPNAPIQESLNAQKPNVRLQFQKQLDLATLNLNEQGALPGLPLLCQGSVHAECAPVRAAPDALLCKVQVHQTCPHDADKQVAAASSQLTGCPHGQG